MTQPTALNCGIDLCPRTKRPVDARLCRGDRKLGTAPCEHIDGKNETGVCSCHHSIAHSVTWEERETLRRAVRLGWLKLQVK